MPKQDLRVPENPEELRKFVSANGYGLEDLLKILDMELNDRKRPYIAMRLVSRINKIRADKLFNETMKRLSG